MKPSGIVTEWVLGSKTGGVRSALLEGIGEVVVARCSDLGNRDPSGVQVEVRERALTQDRVASEHLEQA